MQIHLSPVPTLIRQFWECRIHTTSKVERQLTSLSNLGKAFGYCSTGTEANRPDSVFGTYNAFSPFHTLQDDKPLDRINLGHCFDSE